MIAQTGRTYLLKVLNLNIIGPGLIPLKLRKSQHRHFDCLYYWYQFDMNYQIYFQLEDNIDNQIHNKGDDLMRQHLSEFFPLYVQY
jgi:hypothetical protein